uniref:Uncharacterized protein n=2 Tax=Timema TaxID=61471 RepID=A0A7R9P0I0_9NEOP|nr:unnamed protein product [Timema bartmani]CAD7462909.1 unnamed protein product [Timema tahoe]
MLSMATKSGPDRPETEDQQRLRFQVELDTNTLGEKWSIHSVQDLLMINKYFCGNITPEGGQGYCRLKLNYMPIKIMVAQPMDKASHTNLHDVF